MALGPPLTVAVDEPGFPTTVEPLAITAAKPHRHLRVGETHLSGPVGSCLISSLLGGIKKEILKPKKQMSKALKERVF